MIDLQMLSEIIAEDISGLDGKGDEVIEGRGHNRVILAGIEVDGKDKEKYTIMGTKGIKVFLNNYICFR
jgi:hypothetical protein